MTVKYILPLLLLSAMSSFTYSQTTNKSLPLVKAGKMWSAVWQQRAAEYKALCFQAYNIAALRLDQSLTQKQEKALAVVTDIDETILDNSPNAVSQSLKNKDYELKAWKEWTARGTADTVPGAASFFKYAASRGVEVFYISNRDEDEASGTLENLKRYGFPCADRAHLLLKKGQSEKGSRRNKIAENYNIILLVGDNLSDFADVFDKKNEEQRKSETIINHEEFGKKFIVLPNATYGDWEGALYHYNYRANDEEKQVIIEKILRKE